VCQCGGCFLSLFFVWVIGWIAHFVIGVDWTFLLGRTLHCFFWGTALERRGRHNFARRGGLLARTAERCVFPSTYFFFAPFFWGGLRFFLWWTSLPVFGVLGVATGIFRDWCVPCLTARRAAFKLCLFCSASVLHRPRFTPYQLTPHPRRSSPPRRGDGDQAVRWNLDVCAVSLFLSLLCVPFVGLNLFYWRDHSFIILSYLLLLYSSFGIKLILHFTHTR
jgi:hypothetical protein